MGGVSFIVILNPSGLYFKVLIVFCSGKNFLFKTIWRVVLINVLPWITISTDAIVFVEDYNIFYIPDVAIEEKKIFPLSQAEVVIPEVIFHGIPDWIYEGTYEIQGVF